MITVYGASDDLIEVEGDIAEEFQYEDHMGNGDLLAFADGTVLRVEFTQGIWRITPVVRGSASLTIEQADEDDEGTDRATLDGQTRWVVQGIAHAKAKAAADA